MTIPGSQGWGSDPADSHGAFDSPSGDTADADFADGELRDLVDRVPGYVYKENLDRGGQARVWRAVRAATGQDVAIKVFNDRFGPRRDTLARLEREARALKAINHPGVVGYVEHGETEEGVPFLVMEFVDGRPLNDGAPASGGVDVRGQLRLMLQACEAVAAAHHVGVTHRDISPSNILVTKRGVVKLVDFGLARAANDVLYEQGREVTRAGFFVGKRGYLSPEHLPGKQIGPWSDVFSLGVMLYRILSGGRPPFSAEGDDFDVFVRIAREPHAAVGPFDSSVPKELQRELGEIVDRALIKDPTARFRHAQQLAERLANVLGEWAKRETSREANRDANREAGRDRARPNESGRAAGASPRESRNASEEVWSGGAGASDGAAQSTERGERQRVSNPPPGEARRERDPSVTNLRRRTELVAWARRVRAAIEPHGDVAGLEQIDAAIKRYEANRFTLAVMGKAKRGKSTLINALLGRSDDLIAPVDFIPATSTVTRIRHGAAEKAEVQFRSGNVEPISLRQIRSYVTEEMNPGNRREVVEVRVSGPFRSFEPDLDLVDTPGAGSIHEHHDALLHDFIPSADAVIFMVAADMPIGEDELALLVELKRQDVAKIFFVLNRVDECQPHEVEQAMRHNLGVLDHAGIACDRGMIPLSAKLAYERRVEQSGMPRLKAELGEFLEVSKGALLAERFVTAILDAAQPTLLGLSSAVAAGGKAPEELARELESLRARKFELERESSGAEQRFTASWDRASNALEADLLDAATAVKDEVTRAVDECPLLSLGKFARGLPTLVARSIERHALPATRRFEEDARDACESLQVNYPSLSLGSTGSVSIRTRTGSQVVVAAAGGAVATAAGVSIANAGAAAAAAAAASSVTVTMPTAVGSALTSLGAWIGGFISPTAAGAVGGALGSLGTGTATVAASASPPMWAVLAAPVGWSLVGLGVLVVPIAWRTAKLRERDRIRTRIADDIRGIFDTIKRDRLPILRRAAKPIVAEFSSVLSRQMYQIESSLQSLQSQRPDPREIARKAEALSTLRSELAAAPMSGRAETRGG